MATFLTILGVIVLIAIAAVAALIFVNRVPDHSQYDQPAPDHVIDRSDISEGHQVILDKLKTYHSAPVATDIQKGRVRFAGLFDTTDASDVNITPVSIDGLPAEWLFPKEGGSDTRLLYLHGGAFMVGSPETHRFITQTLVKTTGAAVLAIDYRMMPEHKVVKCHEDAQKAYRFILDNGPNGPGEPGHLFVAGDSAGGALTLATIAWARDNQLRPADGAIGFAPATDASLSSPTWESNLKTDHFLGPSFGRVLKIPKLIRLIAGKSQYGRRTNDPLISPLLGNLSNLPPILLQVSSAEMLYGDVVRYANKASAAGNEVTLQSWPDLVHVFQLFEELPEAHDALSRVADFINQQVAGKRQAA